MNYNMDAINEHRAYIAELQAQLDAANKRTHEASDTADFQYEQAEGLRKMLAERDATIIAFQTRVTELRRDLNTVIDQRNAANARIAELEAAQAWVSVGERLPNDEDEGVIVWTNNGSDCKFYNYDNRIIPENKFYNYDIGFYHEKNGWLLSTEWEHGDPTVTHWMPLPPLPVTP